MIRILLVFFILSVSQHLVSQEKVDIYTFSEAFKPFKNVTQIDSVYNSLIKLSKTESETSLIVIAYANKIDMLGDHKKSMGVISKINSNLSDHHIIVQAEYYQTLGSIAIRSQNPELAIKHYQKAVDLVASRNDIPTVIIQSKYMSLGTGYNALEDNSKAKETFEIALEMEKNGANRNSLYLKLNMALTNSKLGELEDAKHYFLEAMHIIKLNKDAFAEIRTLGNLADIYKEQDSLTLAEKYYLEGKQRAISEGYHLDLIRFESALSTLYSIQGDYQKAYNHIVASDSISNQHNSNSVSEQIVKLEMQHKIEKEAVLKENKEKLLKAEQNKKSWLLIFSSVLGALCLLMIWQLFQLRTKNKVLLQQNLNSIHSEIENNSKENVSNSNNYASIINQLENDTEILENYKDPSLTLDGLAKLLQTNRTYLSEAINSHYQQNFSKWLNTIRINQSKILMANPENDHYSIEGIATTVGFSSISAFNSNFKKITGITPSYFRNNRSYKG